MGKQAPLDPQFAEPLKLFLLGGVLGRALFVGWLVCIFLSLWAGGVQLILTLFPFLCMAVLVF